jgi:hypothetical protein
MNVQNGEFKTTDTPLAAFLIESGFKLLIIEYEPRPNRRDIGTFVFSTSDSKIQEFIDGYNRGDAVANIVVYEHIKSTLLDRIMKGLP